MRTHAFQSATKYAIEIPFEVMKTAHASLPLIKEMALHGNPNSVSDAGVGALCIRTAVMGAYLNVKINASGLKDKEFVATILSAAEIIMNDTNTIEKDIIEIVLSKV